MKKAKILWQLSFIVSATLVTAGSLMFTPSATLKEAKGQDSFYTLEIYKGKNAPTNSGSLGKQAALEQGTKVNITYKNLLTTNNRSCFVDIYQFTKIFNEYNNGLHNQSKNSYSKDNRIGRMKDITIDSPTSAKLLIDYGWADTVKNGVYAVNDVEINTSETYNFGGQEPDYFRIRTTSTYIIPLEKITIHYYCGEGTNPNA